MFRQFWNLAGPYWKSDQKWKGLGLLSVVISLNLGKVYILVKLNEWRGSFYDSLQNLDQAAFSRLIWEFTGWAFAFIAIAVYAVYLTQLLQIWWRTWMTHHLIHNWLSEKTYYLWQLRFQSTDNPDQRITEDVNRFVTYSLDLSLSLLNEIVTLFSFLGLLWTLSGPLSLSWFGGIEIPGYMVWVCLAYAIVGTVITHLIGRKMVKLNFDQQRYEADFRFSLIRLRENSESVALSRGEASEQVSFVGFFQSIINNFKASMNAQKQLGTFQNFYNQASVIVPFLFCAKKFFAKEITLGVMMRVASAFNQVQDSLSYFINAYGRIAELIAVIQRLSGFMGTVDQARQIAKDNNQLKVDHASSGSLELKNLDILLPSGAPLISSINLSIAPGDSLLISGASGSGKSTLIRAIGGIWPFAQGQISSPQSFRAMILPQKPYLPQGSIRKCVAYPAAPDQFSEEQIKSVLHDCRLSHLIDRLDEVINWSQTLSPGEQQRVAFARVLLHQPEWLFLDESTSAMDEAGESALYQLIKERIPRATVVSIGHRSTLDSFHNKKYRVENGKLVSVFS